MRTVAIGNMSRLGIKAAVIKVNDLHRCLSPFFTAGRKTADRRTL